MKVRINGEIKEFDQTLNLERLLSSLNVKKDGLVCELNRSIVNKLQYSQTYLNDNDSLEIVHFVGGG